MSLPGWPADRPWAWPRWAGPSGSKCCAEPAWLPVAYLLGLRWLLHFHVAGSVGGAAAAVVHGALNAVAPGLKARGIKLHVRAASHDLSAGRGVAVG